MGRCYEFGAEIHAGCEQTMVVTAEGGACECVTCATQCPGRFAGCAAVVAIPGRVPPSAPAWAVPGAAPAGAVTEPEFEPPSPGRTRRGPASKARASRRPAPPVGPVVSPLAPRTAVATNGHGPSAPVDLAPVLASLEAIRELLAILVERVEARPADATGPAVEALTKKLVARDTRLATNLGTLTERQAEIAAQMDSFRATVDRLTEAVSSTEAQPTRSPSLRQILGRKT